MDNIKFQTLAISFLEKLFLALEKAEIELSTNWDIDHLCYRVESVERYEELKMCFSLFGNLLIESHINGRPIATFKLNCAITFKNWVIDVVELPAPKASKVIAEGFEHIEVVCDLSFSDIQEKYKHLNLDISGLNKELNQELEIKLGDMCLKFHHISLESVIRIEKNSILLNAIEDSNILRSFKVFTPFIAGVFPLGIQNHNSDVDVLMSALDLDSLESLLISHYENHEGFECLRSFFDGVETLIVNFDQEQISFEIFAQSRSIVEQKTFKIFQIEERLLKLGGEIFKETIDGIRMEGTRAELAFAESLDIDSDPSSKLLNLQKLDAIELKNLFNLD